MEINIKEKVWVFTMQQDTLLRKLDAILTQSFQVCVSKAGAFVLAEGEVPLLLIAHCDGDRITEEIYFDPDKQVLWSPEGLNADDRAGVLAILEILDRGYRPSVLFTADEELGCRGAQALIASGISPPHNVRALIGLDRRGARDAVYYDCDNAQLKEWVSSFGWDEALGTFSDISVLGPHWDIGAVNLSVGYYFPHGPGEYLRVNELEASIRRVIEMIERPPSQRFRHRSRSRKEKKKGGKKKYGIVTEWLPATQHKEEKWAYWLDPEICELCEQRKAETVDEGLLLCWECWESLRMEEEEIICPRCLHRFSLDDALLGIF